MKHEKMDMTKILAMLAQPKEKPEPLTNVERRRLDIPYITNENKVEIRPFHLIMPEGVNRPLPLIFVPHYEMGEDALELRSYLKKGWAVASPADFIDLYNGQLTDDDLVFNNAALYTLRNMPEIDRTRIAVVGGSAGGYMALMLDALQLGICCSVANAPITNVYFNLFRHFTESNKLNQKALDNMSVNESDDKKKKDPIDIMKRLAGLPIPFVAGLIGIFSPVRNNFPDPTDMERWEVFSPVALAELFCNPIMINHSTSDILVPIDQLSKRFTYDKPGDSLPEDYSCRLPEDIPGKLGRSLEERLPAERTRTECISVTDPDKDSVLPYAADKLFNLNIFDDGPVEGYSSHSAVPGKGHSDDTPYLEEMLALTSAKTNILTPDKLLHLLERYLGKSIQLPANEGVDDTVYGSLAVYRKEVCDELNEWVKNNGKQKINEVLKTAILFESDINKRNDLQNTMEEILDA